MSRSRYDHVHQYKATNTKLNHYKCTIPGCPHSITTGLMLGRTARCPNCLEELIIGKGNLKYRTISHKGCSKHSPTPSVTKPVKPPSLGELIAGMRK